ncbi:hypothetical protein JXB02_05805 [Candidatus Woesearchaeota archaeon]|nr:hypothetical protein [Candidatus Woesearchaeota archaeon]
MKRRQTAGKGKPSTQDLARVVSRIDHIKSIEYGTKELIHGIIIGIVIGFFLALFLLG